MFEKLKEKAPGATHYFPHIDGIRCLAVIPVVLYHLRASTCPGGFLGVDVFFVISGYLICGGIMRDLEAGRFSFTSFYYRRIRRIFPAYFALVVSVLIAGFFLYHWGRFLPLAQTAIFSAGFSANVYFWISMGYFQPTAHGNPLLHLWSLGVEEHFYLLIPLALWGLWKVMRSRSMWVLGAALLMSFAACVVLGEAGESTTAFYILPTRAWELLAGAMICRLGPSGAGRLPVLGGIVGAALVLGSYYFIGTGATFGDAGTNVAIRLPGSGVLTTAPFPGWVTAPVVVGTMLLLRFGATGGLGRILGSLPFVGVGKISYSLYLWHWPIFVFMAYVTYERQTVSHELMALVASFVLAGLSWRWIEMPVRQRPGFTPRVAFLSAGIGTALVVGIGATVVATEGMRTLWREEVNRLAPKPYGFLTNLDKFSLESPEFHPEPYPAYDENFVTRIGNLEGKPEFFVIGDSHGAAFVPGLDRVAQEQGISGYYLDRRVSPYIREGSGTLKIFEWVAAREEVEEVYIIDRWLHQYDVHDGMPRLGERGTIPPVVLPDATADEIESQIVEMVTWWRARGKRVALFTCVPEYLYSPGDIAARRQIIPLNDSIEITEQDYRNRQNPVSQVFEKVASMDGVRIIPLGEVFLRDGQTVVMADDGDPFYRDEDHLSLAGAVHAARLLASELWDEEVSSQEREGGRAED